MEEQRLEEFFSEDTGTEPEPVSRRQFLSGAVVGGVYSRHHGAYG